jgi:hypothetical protein
MDFAAMAVAGRRSDRPFLGSNNPKNGNSRAIFGSTTVLSESTLSQEGFRKIVIEEVDSMRRSIFPALFILSIERRTIRISGKKFRNMDAI